MSQDNRQNTGPWGPQPTNLPQAGPFYTNPAPSTISGFQQPTVQPQSTPGPNYQLPSLQPQPTSTTSTGYSQPIVQPQSTPGPNYQSPSLQPQPTSTTSTGYQQPIWQDQTTTNSGYQAPSMQPQYTTSPAYFQPNLQQQAPPTQYHESVVISSISNMTTQPPPNVNNDSCIVTLRDSHYLRTPEGYLRRLTNIGDKWFVQQMTTNMELFAPYDNNNQVATQQGQGPTQQSANLTGQGPQQAPPTSSGYDGLQFQSQTPVSTILPGQNQWQTSSQLPSQPELQPATPVDRPANLILQGQQQSSAQLPSQSILQPGLQPTTLNDRPANLILQGQQQSSAQLPSQGGLRELPTQQREAGRGGVVTKAAFYAYSHNMAQKDAGLLRQYFNWDSVLQQRFKDNNTRLRRYLETGDYEGPHESVTRRRVVKQGSHAGRYQAENEEL